MVLMGPLPEKLKIVSQIFLLLHFKRRICGILLQKIPDRVVKMCILYDAFSNFSQKLQNIKMLISRKPC